MRICINTLLRKYHLWGRWRQEVVQNIGAYLPNCTASHPMRRHISLIMTAMKILNIKERTNVMKYQNPTRCLASGIAQYSNSLRAGRYRGRIRVWARFAMPPERLRGPPNLLYNLYRIFPEVKRPDRGAEHLSPSSAFACRLCLHSHVMA